MYGSGGGGPSGVGELPAGGIRASQGTFSSLFTFSITPLCPYYVCSNPIMIIFSVDGHHLAFLYDRT